MTAYYNEFDQNAAAWLRELIRLGLIAPGVVDERSILDVQPDDLRGFTQCHFFAGIGGWSAALRLASVSDDTPLWTGPPPCQPFSSAGQQKGQKDERHLAPHWATLIDACAPPVVFGEQVASAAVFGKAAKRARGSVETGAADGEWAWLDDLFDRLEGSRYACGASDIPAAGVDAPHIRQRTFFGAVRIEGMADTSVTGLEGHRRHGDGSHEPGRIEAKPTGHATTGGGPYRLADSDGRKRDGLAIQQGHVGHGQDAGRSQERGQSGSCGERGRLAGSDCATGREVARGTSGDENQNGRAGRDRVKPHVDNGPAGHGENNRTGPSDRPWATADWVHCRDAKWRPVEPASQRMANGVSFSLGYLRGNCLAESKEVKHAAKTDESWDEALRALRAGNEPEKVWFEIGGRIGFPQATILFAIVCEYAWSLGSIRNRFEARSPQNCEAILRTLREVSSENACTPQGRKSVEQQSSKLGNTLSELSQKSPRVRELVEILAAYGPGPLTTTKSTARVMRLKGYGNAIVPQAAAVFVRCFLDALGNNG